MARGFSPENVHLNTSVREIVRMGKKQYSLFTADGRELHFDHIIFAVDNDEILKVLGSNIDTKETEIIQGLKTTNNIAVLHSDPFVSKPQPSIINNTTEQPLTHFKPAGTQHQRILASQGLSYGFRWTGRGFLEDAVTAGLEIAIEHFGAQVPFEVQYHPDPLCSSKSPSIELGFKDHLVRTALCLARVYALVFQISWILLGALGFPVSRVETMFKWMLGGDKMHLVEGGIGNVETFCLGAKANDGLDLVGRVRVGGDDEEASEEVRGNAVCGADVVGAADDSVAAVGGEDNNGGD
ncbi:unnamed protein product [Aspergillus oryzae]|uniref:Unnamed protein product n=1 Tax=Aspergillus oryzae TaxID=5062 RepID=A0AAN5BTJ7_ASPOZ|nr:unnamed protein product [Aspergillus oryzae]GMG24195.1 unnamed protein product [Aspergillus oryzae]